MSATAALLVLVVLWLAIGIVSSLVMARRGHRAFTWGVLGAVLGPLVIALARQDLRHDPEASAVTLSPGSPGVSGVDVLVGVDGSPESRAAVDAVIDLLGERLGRLTLLAVIDFDTAAGTAGAADRARAEERLRAAARHVQDRTGNEPAQVLEPGKPADALSKHAQQSGAEMLAIGSRGHGASKAMLGSVATALTRRAPVPVLVVSAPS